jgi:NADPH2:quinone reductase
MISISIKHKGEFDLKAVAIEQFGNPDVFQIMDLPRPKSIPGHVLIRVAASSVNPVDTVIRNGFFPPISHDFPAILHGDVAGVIEEVGPDVTNFKPGDEVYACAGGVKGLNGALAEFMLADADLVALKPKSLSMAESAALPLVSITAWEALMDRAKIKADQAVLIHAAAGGVGSIAIQLAKWAKAKVFTTASTEEKLATGRKLGADVTINYREQTVQKYVNEYTEGKGFDIVFDTVGGENLDKSFEAAKVNGTVVSISTISTHDLTLLHTKGLNLHVVFMLIPMLYGVNRKNHGKILANIAKLVDEDHIRPLLDSKSFTFSEVAQAHRHLESGRAVGKVTLINDLI